MLRTRSQQLPYGIPTTIVAPNDPKFLSIVTSNDPNTTSSKPRIVWLEDSARPQRKEHTVILFQGDTDLDYEGYRDIKPLFVTNGPNRRHNTFATLCTATPTNPATAPVDPTPPPKKAPTPHSPESLAAIEAAKQKERKAKEREEELRSVVTEADVKTDAELSDKIAASLRKKDLPKWDLPDPIHVLSNDLNKEEEEKVVNAIAEELGTHPITFDDDEE